ncbi:MAG: hypothetical protein Q8904_08515 [Bacteroidota bacterium]|nr:hypothetical protein [Bacteroidota bacterium]
MEKKKRTKAPSMEDLIPDATRRQEVIRRLYNNESLLGKGGIFTDIKLYIDVVKQDKP